MTEENDNSQDEATRWADEHDLPVEYYYALKKLGAKKTAQMERERERERRKPIERETPPAEFKGDQWVSMLYLSGRWEKDLKPLAELVLEKELPIYLLHDGDRPRAEELLQSRERALAVKVSPAWIDTPYQYIEDYLAAEDECENADPFCRKWFLLGVFSATVFKLSDITIVEKLHPELGRATKEHWLNATEVKALLTLNDYRLDGHVADEQLPMYFFWSFRGIYRAYITPLFGRSDHSLFKPADVKSFLDKHPSEKRKRTAHVKAASAEERMGSALAALCQKHPGWTLPQYALELHTRFEGQLPNGWGLKRVRQFVSKYLNPKGRKGPRPHLRQQSS